MSHTKFNARDSWNRLARHYEQSRTRVDSLDTLVEFPAQIEFIGSVSGRRLLDVGCGSGAKALYFAGQGAARVVAVDISDSFIDAWRTRETPANLEFAQGDINALDEVELLRDQRFDLILCLAVIGYAKDRSVVLRTMASHLAPGGSIFLMASSPIRFAVEKAERFGLPLGAAYRAHPIYSYASGWNPDVILEHQTPMLSEMLNSFAAAGLFVNRCLEPDMPEHVRREFPRKAEWWDRYGGVVLYELQVRSTPDSLRESPSPR